MAQFSGISSPSTIFFQVDIEVESIDKGGNFIGYLHLDSTNVSVALVEEGYAAGWMADKSTYGRQIQACEDNAKRRKEKRWANYVEQAPAETNEDEEKKDEGERKVA